MTASRIAVIAAKAAMLSDLAKLWFLDNMRAADSVMGDDAFFVEVDAAFDIALFIEIIEVRL